MSPSQSSVTLGSFAVRRLAWIGFVLALLLGAAPARAQNPVVVENGLPGNPSSEWDIAGVGDTSIEGFATRLSVQPGETIRFKIRSTHPHRIKIYRLGWYAGLGARRWDDIGPFPAQAQPTPYTEATTGLIDCGNWAETASWPVPVAAVSGVYIARLERTDTGGASHIAFIVRDDARASDLLFKTSDGTWQAYNTWGGNSLYVGNATAPPVSRAHKVSYNRPFETRGTVVEDWLFNAEYPMIRWLERNGYDVTYTTDLDVAQDLVGPSNRLRIHDAVLSVGHDEYWSASERAAFEDARGAGVHLAFFSGNEIYWKTRWEPSPVDADPNRTMVCYKEGTAGEITCGSKCDPLSPNIWTGLWRSGCAPEYPGTDACLPENALSGNISWVGSTGSISVPATYGDLRFWRNTSVATLTPGQTATLAAGSLGYEWDFEQFDAFYPPGRITLSSTTLGGKQHRLSLYRHSSGALVFGAGTVQWPWGLDGTHDRGASVEDPRMQQATINLFADMGVQPATMMAGMVAATASTDATAPTSAITAPLHASTAANNSTVVITGTASDAGGVVAGVEVSVDGGTTWQVATGTTAWSFNWVPTVEATYVIKSRAFDDSGNMETPGAAPATNAISVTISGSAPCPCNLFASNDVPATPLARDNATGIEVGMKFRTTANGYITAVRFYKGAGTTGTHTAHLWSANGTLLGSGSFIAETASGWQETNLDAAVQVTPGTTYVVSCHSTSGDYAFTNPYFTVADVNGPLRGLATGEDGDNGVYIYTATPAFPTSNYQSSNYWVDVVFVESVGPDVTAPVVTSRTPAPGATNVAAGASITALFNEAMDAATMTSGNFVLSPAVAGVVSYNAGTRTITFDPVAALAYSTTYTATLSTSITDVAGNPLAAAEAWSFTTQAEPPPPPPLPTEGPGGPILLISASTNPLSRYPVEILRAEGFNAFNAVDVSTVDATVLNAHDVVVLGDIPVSGTVVGLLDTWVNAGGTLIVLRPEAGNTALHTLLGLVPAAGSTAEGYLLINTASGPGAGLVNETIQFHGTADHYTLTGGATSLATLYSNATTATIYPAVTKRLVGSNGGSASAFTYDLARSVVYTRQGNPAWAGQNRETTDGVIRSNDLFYGNASGDPQTDWVNLDKAEIPQADEQQHLLSNLITLGSLHRKPMPRFWFLPSKHKAAVVMTGDDHGTGLTASFFDDFITQSGSNNTPLDVTNWTAVRGTSYMYPNTILANADSYQSQGFEVGIHVDTGCNVWTPASMQASYTSNLASFAANFPNISAPSTHRTHCIAWSDFSSQPSLEASLGIRLDVNYYYWPQAWLLNRPGLFTGSGLPMRFAEADGDLIDCFQVTTQFTDESGQTYPLHYQTLIDNALGSEGYYGVFCANFHTDRQSSRALAAGLIDYAQSKSPAVPVISARQLLTWLDGRNASTYSEISFSGTTLSFTASVGAGANNLYGMLPVNTAVGALSGISNGGPVAYTTETIKGIPYAFFPVTNGNYSASYAPDLTASVITDVVATPSSNGTATITWTTDEPASSRVDFGTDPGPLTLNSTSAALVTSHSMVLYGLALNTTYNFRVTSVDGASNSASEPVSPNTLSFTMPNGLCAQDDLAADFSLGAPDANTLVVSDDGGAVILKPNTNEEFDGSTVPSGWTSANLNPGATTVGGGSVTVNGTHLYSNGSYGPGTTLDFVATFNSAVYQNVGFSNDQAFGSAPWVTVGQGGTADGNLYARASNGTSISLGNLLGAPHRFRLQWNASNFEVYVDNATTPTATINLTVSANMYVQISDVQNNDGTLSVDRMRITPYATAGSYTSRVFNQGTPDGWGVANWTASVPSGTSLAMLARTGNTVTPDGSWTAFLPLTNGVAVGGGAQYLQYRADLATTDNTVTPVLNSMSIACGNGPDLGAPVIEIWFGDVQEFGIHGEPQVWCNIQGHVFDTDGTITSLSYKLNGGASVALSIGPDNRRLLLSGDFNIDLTVGDLLPGANTVQITAVDNDSNPTVKSVTVNYTAGNVWPLPYSVDWSTLADSSEVNDVAHVVDGNWTLTAGGIRTAEAGYDRLIAIGDKTWTNYEVLVPFTLHDMPSGAGVGVLMRWKGHTNDPVTCPQPRCGWQPLGDIAWYRPGQLQFYEGNNVSRTIPLEVTQLMRVSVETDGSAQTTYKMKVWEQGTTEPLAWDLSYIAGAADEMAGSLLLITHLADVTFGNVTVTAGSLSISNIEVQLANGNTEATITWNTNQPTSSRIDHGPTAAYENGFMETPALVTSHSTVLTGLTPNTIYHYALSGVNAASELVSTADRIFSTFDSGIVSDDFCSSTLAPMWTFNNPLADASYALTGSASSDAWLEISVPAGPEHQIYNSGINAPGLLQPMNNADFEVEVKFESAVAMPEYQQQGILVKESESKFLRFEVFSKSPGNTILYAQAFDLPATSPAAVNTSIGASGIFPLYMRVKREGNQWTLTYSFNGTDWLPGTSFSFAMDPNEIGPYAGNALGNSAPAHVGKVDYFMNLGDPIVAEDGCVEAAPILALIGDRSVEEGASLNVGISANDPNGNETDLVFSSTGLPAFAQLFDNVDGTANLWVDPLPGDAGTYPVTITVTDLDLLFDEETFDIVVTVPPAGMVSDDFCAGTLGAQWTFVDPLGDGSMQFTDPGTPDASLSLSVPAGVAHQVWTNGIRVPHIAQATSDDTLSVEVKLLSGVNAPQYQEQGLFFKQDEHHFLRFEVYSTNSTTSILAAVLSSATNSFPLTSSIPVNLSIGALGVAPVYMRVERVGNLWTQSYSFDGSAWQVAGSLTSTMDVVEVGLYVGNETGTGSPAHTARFDYFEDLSAPLVIEDGCQAPDVTAPVISDVVATPAPDGLSATIIWTTDEAATSLVEYGTDPNTLNLQSSDGSLLLSHSLPLAGLTPGTTYHYRVTSVDLAGNSATAPEPPAAPLQFNTPSPPCFTDAAEADFAQGTFADTYLAAGDNAVVLRPTAASEFTTLPPTSEWDSYPWTGGTSTVSGGVLSVDGARYNVNAATTFGPGSVLEFVATFKAADFQNIGFAAGTDATGPGGMFNDLSNNWAVFGVLNGGAGSLYVRTLLGGGSVTDVLLGAAYIGSPHRYRIEWNTNNVVFYIDGALVHTAAITIGGTMRPAISDYANGGEVLQVDWIRATPYLTPGTFTSRVHDAGSAVSWGAFNWTATTPVGTSLVMSARTGDTPVPDGSWSAFAALPSPGSSVGSTARYLQYRAELAASDPTLTPSLADVSVQCSACAGAPTAIADLAATATGNAGGGRTNVLLDWSAVPSGQTVAVYRKAWGDYPLYRGAPHGGVPAVPATPGAAVTDGWTLTGVTAPNGLDAPPARGSWYHVAFVTGSCGVSGPSNLTGGTLDYVLGDFSDGLEACAGDNVVNGADLSLLGAHYGAAISGPGDPNACMDIGPSVGYSTTGRPLPDGILEFEDLVLCALNFHNTGPIPLRTGGSRGETASADELQLRMPELPAVGETFIVPVWAHGGGRIHALSLDLAYDASVISIVGVESGPLLDAQGVRAVVLSPRPGRIDLALLGGEAGLSGEGELVHVFCRRIADGEPALALAHVEARDGANRSIDLGAAPPRAEVVPSRTQLAPARPNPFRGTVALSFSLAAEGAVDLALYSVDGRRVRTLTRGVRAAGDHVLSWDGRDESGAQVPTGVYYARMVSAAGRMMQTVTYLR